LTQFALKKLDVVVDEFWAEISDSIQTIEVVYEAKMYPQEVRFDILLVFTILVYRSFSLKV
jgi:hypothetical protein